MTDRIRVLGISAQGHHGVFAFEAANGQTFALDVELEVDTRAAARSDDLADTTSYAEVAADLYAMIDGERFNLLETVAERMAVAALRHDGVDAVTVTVHKPEAPVGVPFTDVQLQIRRTRLSVVPLEPVTVVLALGGNIGDVEASLRTAVGSLRVHDGLEDVRVGPLVRTAAMTLPGSDPQADYLNTVVSARTRLAADEVLRLAHRLEASANRTREVRWGPRTLDVDVVAFGDVVSEDPELLLPHPGALVRPFVVVPWAELEPERAVAGETLVSDVAGDASGATGAQAAAPGVGVPGPSAGSGPRDTLASLAERMAGDIKDLREDWA